jgi:hypothetical protein
MKSKRILFALVLNLVITAVLGAQGLQTGAVRGTINDDDGKPLPGVNVNVTGPALIGSLSAVTGIDGAYRVNFLPTGTYVITANLSGFETVKREGVIVRVGMTVTINFVMSPETLKKEITVVAPSPNVDVVSTKTDVTLAQESITNIPIARDVNNLLNLAPGTTNLSIKGAARNNHAFNLDGINDNAPNQNYGEVYIPWDAVDEVEIVTGGAGAETFQGVGGAINIVTKSGGNRFSGQAQVYYTNDKLSHAVVPPDKLASVGSSLPAIPVLDYDYSGTLGGPIIKDRIWFFVNYRRQYTKNNSSFIPTTILGVPYNSYALEQGYSYYLGKITALPWKNFRIFGMLIVPRRDTPVFDNVARRTIEANRWQLLDQRTTSFNAIWTLSPDTLIDLTAGSWWNNGQNMDTKAAKSNGPYFVDDYTGYEWGRQATNFFGFKRNYIAGAKITQFLDSFLGSEHQIKGGVEYQIGSMRSFSPLSNGMQWDYYNGNPYYYRGLLGLNQADPEFGDGLLYFSNASSRDVTTETANSSYAIKRRLGLFVQDVITFQRRLSVTLGVRYDIIRAEVPDLSKPAAVDALGRALSAAYILPAYGVDPFGVFSWTKFDNPFPYNFLSPFIGLSYDLFGSGKTALKFSYGRYAEGVMTDNIPQPPISPANFQFRWFDTNGNAQPDLPGIDNYKFVVGASNPNYMVGEAYKNSLDPKIKIPYEHQFVFGFDHELFRDFKLSLNYTYKTRRNEMVSVYYDRTTGQYWSFNDSYWVPFTTTVPASGIFPANTVTAYFRKATSPELYLRTTNLPNDKLKQRYNSFELSFNKRMSHGWSLGGSFVYTDLKGNLEYSGGYVQGAFRDPNYLVNRYGDLAFSMPVIIKLYGTVTLPYRFLLSFFYQYQDGNGWGRNVTIYAPAAWRAANNIDPSQPSNSLLLETPGTRRNQESQSLDLRIEKEFDLGRYGQIGAFVDVFNALGFSSFSAAVNPAGAWRPDSEGSTSTGTFTPARTGFNAITGGVITFKFSLRWSFSL